MRPHRRKEKNSKQKTLSVRKGISGKSFAAEEIVFDDILRLEQNDFSKRVFMWSDVDDLYGLESYLGHNWYVKFLTENKTIEEISFHYTLQKSMFMHASISDLDLDIELNCFSENCKIFSLI